MPSSSKKRKASSSGGAEETPEERDERLVRELEQQLEEVLELLTLQKDTDVAKSELDDTQQEHEATRGSKQRTWLQHKGKQHNLAVNMHAQANLKLVEALRLHKKFTRHPKDLTRHLDSLTDRLLKVVQRQYGRKGDEM